MRSDLPGLARTEPQTTEHGSNLDIVWREDPRMLGIRLARYKFVAKMFAGFDTVIEIGAGSGQLSRVVAHSVGTLLVTDANPPPGLSRFDPAAEIPDILRGGFRGAFALDVIEHIPAEIEDRWIAGVQQCLDRRDGTLIIGSPSLESQPYGSRKSRESHVNCKTENGLRETMGRHFRNVFMFGMNDEVVHTGFGPMCHYRFALCLGF